MLTHWPLEPSYQSLMCSMAALAAEAAEESFLALMMAAPLCYTVGMKSLLYHSWSNLGLMSWPWVWV